jgi:hypothetical protein
MKEILGSNGIIHDEMIALAECWHRNRAVIERSCPISQRQQEQPRLS